MPARDDESPAARIGNGGVHVESCTEPSIERPAGGPAEALLRRRDEWIRRLEDLRESVDSEWSAASQALRGAEPMRKWLGWALYRLAARVNPEIDEQ